MNEADKKHVVLIWTKFLPYHLARIRYLHAHLEARGYRLTALEVASRDSLYPFPEAELSDTFNYVSIFPGASYRALNPLSIHRHLYKTIAGLHPDFAISPSTPFPSGMASIRYALTCGTHATIMDDAWEYSDRRGWIVRAMKRQIHKNIDAAFVPAPSHAAYYENLGIPSDRQVYGVDVVDNSYFASHAKQARQSAQKLRERYSLPEKYFLFVGRLINRKGVDRLVAAYRLYKRHNPQGEWGLVIVGEGDQKDQLRILAKDEPGMIFAGAKFGNELCIYYGLASALVLPSEVETWGLVVNEALASGLPVLVSKGCGCATTLVVEGENGWTFSPHNVEALSRRMEELALLELSQLARMSARSEEIISHWSLDTFVNGVLAAIALPRRQRGNLFSKIITRLWMGRISFYP
jgi:glycosyltransferase involved in cell wall biosynthesis